MSKEIDEFILPEKWIVKINSKEEGIVICKWAEFTWYNDYPINVNFVNYRRIWSNTNVENLPEITFEELCEHESTFNGSTITQVIHLSYLNKGNETVITHIDHEFVFYSKSDYEKRKVNSDIKGKSA